MTSTMSDSTTTLIRGGQVHDGTGAPPQQLDVRINDQEILEVGKDLPSNGNDVFDASDLIVAPGLIDLHAHVYHGTGIYSIDPKQAGLKTGVTTLLDTGSAGALTYGTFHEYVMRYAQENIFALLNIAQPGVQGHPNIDPYLGDLFEIRHLHVPTAVECIKAYPDRILGTKVRLTASLAEHREANERAGLSGAVEAANQTGLLCMVHHLASSIPQPEMLEALRPGDIVTHVYHGQKDTGFSGPDGQPSKAMQQARDRGILFDVGHGVGSFTWRIAEPACQQYDFWPDTISTDVHIFNLGGPVFDLPTTMTKFLYLGMSLENVIQACTSAPARAMKMESERGMIRPGMAAEITTLRLLDGHFDLFDVDGQMRSASQRLIPVTVFHRGLRVQCDT